MTTPPRWHFRLTPEDATKIALISINWSAVDLDLGGYIEWLAGLNDPIRAADLVNVIDIRKKIDIIDNWRRRGRTPALSTRFIREIVWVGNHFRPDRNLLAQGVLTDGANGPTMWSEAKLRALDLTHLDLLLDQAQYGAHVAFHLKCSLANVVLADPLPPRPPERPE